ncbi:hypothetical protein [Mycobacteroides chelonae]
MNQEPTGAPQCGAGGTPVVRDRGEVNDYQDTGSRRKPTAYTETGAADRVCPDCSAPENHPCRWITTDGVGDPGKPRHFPHETRWRR